MSAEQMDDWFKIGKDVKVETVAKTKLGGRLFDPNKGGAAEPLRPQFYLPSYRRNSRYNNPQQTAYAEEYRNHEANAQLDLLDSASAVHPNQDYESYAGSQSVASESLIEKIDASTLVSQTTNAKVVHRPTNLLHIELPRGMTEQQACSVYSTYDFTHRCDNHLSISKYRQDIIDLIESNQVTIIQGETGSGKTTQVAQYILDEYAANQRYCNIVVTQPRRIAAVSIAKRVCAERNWQLGGICGYQIGMDRVASEDTRLLYCTTGVLLEKLIAGKNLHQFTHIILDEVHERDEDTDFCMLVVKKFLNTNSRDTKVVLMSATFDTHLFGKYYARPVGGRLETAPAITVEGRSYVVNEYYLDDLSALGRPAIDYYRDGPGLPVDVLDIAVKLLLKFDDIETPRHGEERNKERGSVLVFLPGIGEIEEMDSLLQKEDLAKKNKFHIRALHSMITSDEQIQVFKPAPQGARKIILSTNIAESSITIPDIRYVIDFCLTKTQVCDPNTNYTSLQLQWASKANCTQRKGRAGRVANGRCYRLVTNKFYNSELEEYGQPEMQRCRLDHLVLHVKKLNIGEPKAVLALALSPPNLDDIERTILALIEVGALRSVKAGQVNPHDGELTFVGHVLGSMPVDLPVGKLMLLAHVFGFLDEAIIVAAATALKNFFAQPFKSGLKSYSKKLAWSGDSFSDCIAYVKAYKEWKFQKDLGRFYTSSDELKWCTENWIQMRRIQDVDELVKDLTRRLKTFNVSAPSGPLYRPPDLYDPETQLMFKLVLAGAFYPNYFLQSPVDHEEAVKELSGYNPCSTVMVRGLPLNHGHLYKTDLEQKFSWCDEGRKPRVSFESSRAYIEFSRDVTERTSTRILPAVYRAIKMKQLQESRSLLTVSPNFTVAGTKNSAAAASSSAPGSYSSAADSTKFEPHQVELPGPNKKIINIQATEIIECGRFWATYMYDPGDPMIPKIRQLYEKIPGYVYNTRPMNHRFKVDDYCLAPFSDPTGVWYYRARILKIVGQEAQVFFVDFGNKCVVPVKSLHPLHPELFDPPFQAFECELSGIKPSVIKCPAGVWTDEANMEFKKVIDSARKLWGEVYSVVHSVVRIQLIVITGDNREFCLNDALVMAHYADVASEPYLSQMSCIERDRLATVDNFCSGRTSNSNDELESKLGQMSLTSAASSISESSSHPMDLPNARPVLLKGPYSPYEVEYMSCTYIGKNWPTRIERDSVNSISLNTESSSGFSSRKVMVAASVALNQSARSITARDTTILPALPGLLSLVTLIFTPVSELRIDERRTKYTGALCGLGTTEETYESGRVFGGSQTLHMAALPENDVELVFDVDIDDEDIKMINNIRITINLGIGYTEKVASWTEDTVIKLQNKARDTLIKIERVKAFSLNMMNPDSNISHALSRDMASGQGNGRLLRRRRETVDPMPYHNQYQWKQLPQEYVVKAQIEDMLLYSLHDLCELVNDETSSVSSCSTQQPLLLGIPQPSCSDVENWTSNDKVLHQRYLEKIASSMSLEQKEILCKLCPMKLNSARELHVHLKSLGHRRNKPVL